MQYVAANYVSVDGKLIVRGEFIPGRLPKDQLDWLLSTGAVIEVPEVTDVSEEADKVEEKLDTDDHGADDQEIEIELPTAAKKSRRQNKGKEG